MATTYYHTVDGRIEGQSTAGVRTDYLTDALGSVVATVNSSAGVVNTYRYKPYGERLAKTGVGGDPRFGWTGDTGSCRTERSYSNQYNRARHYASLIGAFASQDPLSSSANDPDSNAFMYASASPTTLSDPSGLHPCDPYTEPCDYPEARKKARDKCVRKGTILHSIYFMRREQIMWNHEICTVVYCCSFCYKTCRDVPGSFSEPPNKKKFLNERLKGTGWSAGPPVMANPHKADRCGYDSSGLHWMWYCKDKENVVHYSLVASVLCCYCYENGVKQKRCTHRGCHKKP